MTSDTKKLYLDNDDLVNLSHRVPVLVYENNSSTSPQLNESFFTSEEDDYLDDQIIPWRKLYVRERYDINQLESSFSSSFVKSLVQYNQWPAIILSSIISSLITIPIDWAITWLNNLKYGYCISHFFTVRESCPAGDWYNIGETLPIGISFFVKFTIMLLITTLFAILGLKISESYSCIAKSGISELKLIISGHVNHEFLQPKVIIRKYIALLFVCASGGLLIGYEGPLIHISCGVISFIMDMLQKNFRFFSNLNNAAIRREMISVGFTIGISLAFGSPIGGLLFTIENLKLGMRYKSLIWNGFVCSCIATFIFFKFHPFRKIIINESFEVEVGNGWIFFETLPYLLVGLICGLLSIAYKEMHLKIVDFRNSVKFPTLLKNPYIEIVALSSFTQLLHYPLNFDHLTLNNMLVSLFYDCSSTSESYYQAICKSSHETLEVIYYTIIIFFQSNYSYTLDIPGGILLPSLIIGAGIGRVIGDLIEVIQHHFGKGIFQQCFEENKKCVSPGSYAIVGAASFFAGVTNTSVSAVVIVFEVTGAVTYLIPLMLGVVVAKTTVDIFESKGFYELWLEKINKSYLSTDVSDSLKLAHLAEIKIGDVIEKREHKTWFIEDVLNVSEVKGLIDDEEDTDVDIKNDGLILLHDKVNKTVAGWISYVDILNAIVSQPDHKIVNFQEQSNDLINVEVVQLKKYVVPIQDLFIVNKSFTVLTAYDLMTNMLVTNVIVCGENNKFEGMLTVTELSKIVKG
ncbi:hypothetical protein CANINC_002614 [Pichia inconspicua]|uniref:CBS domain-containing protein n=1 Tax=Pichia inconspicua TaxID=52247 RepID=A0A4T0X126_9ASCO|nr:hypothetical protein CANINC_002614 [[Candida] inconspicua]